MRLALEMGVMSINVERRMPEMMRQLRVDVLELCYDKVGATFETARDACEHCTDVDACLTWLETNQNSWTPEFCPNRELFKRFSTG